MLAQSLVMPKVPNDDKYSSEFVLRRRQLQRASTISVLCNRWLHPTFVLPYYHYGACRTDDFFSTHTSSIHAGNLSRRYPCYGSIIIQTIGSTCSQHTTFVLVQAFDTSDSIQFIPYVTHYSHIPRLPWHPRCLHFSGSLQYVII